MSARIPIPPVPLLWDHPASECRKISTWKQQLDTLINSINRQLPEKLKLTDEDKNNILHSHLGVEAARRFEHHPVMAKKSTTSYGDFYRAIVETLQQRTSQAVSFHQLCTPRQDADESCIDFVIRLCNLQADTALAFCLVTNCYNVEAQKRMFVATPSLLMQSVENADASAAAVRRELSICKIN